MCTRAHKGRKVLQQTTKEQYIKPQVPGEKATAGKGTGESDQGEHEKGG